MKFSGFKYCLPLYSAVLGVSALFAWSVMALQLLSSPSEGEGMLGACPEHSMFQLLRWPERGCSEAEEHDLLYLCSSLECCQPGKGGNGVVTGSTHQARCSSLFWLSF